MIKRSPAVLVFVLGHHTHAYAAVDYTCNWSFRVVDDDDEGMVMHLRKHFGLASWLVVAGGGVR